MLCRRQLRVRIVVADNLEQGLVAAKLVLRVHLFWVVHGFLDGVGACQGCVFELFWAKIKNTNGNASEKSKQMQI